jgi:hypothetical protein
VGSDGFADEDEPKDATKVDEFRLDDLANEETRVQRSAASAKSSESKPAADDTTDAATSSARSPKDKM